MSESVSHQDIHDKLTAAEHNFEQRHGTLIKWLVGVIFSVVAVTMTQIVSVAASLAEVDGTQELVLQSINRIDRKLETQDRRIQDESREAEEDLKSHRDEYHNKRI
mgnify:CR=1 FL=1